MCKRFLNSVDAEMARNVGNIDLDCFIDITNNYVFAVNRRLVPIITAELGGNNSRGSNIMSRINSQCRLKAINISISISQAHEKSRIGDK
jgi:hypothetical protein